MAAAITLMEFAILAFQSTFWTKEPLYVFWEQSQTQIANLLVYF